MSAHEIIRSRRSIRRYRPDPIPKAHIESMLEAAMMAPSACNTRPWEFYVVQDQALKEKLVQISPYIKHMLHAPVNIIVCGRPDLQEGICSTFWPQDCGAAIQNILLEAAELGYGTCWCGLYPSGNRDQAAQALLGCQGVPLAIITVGVPDESPKARGYFDPDRVHYL